MNSDDAETSGSSPRRPRRHGDPAGRMASSGPHVRRVIAMPGRHGQHARTRAARPRTGRVPAGRSTWGGTGMMAIEPCEAPGVVDRRPPRLCVPASFSPGAAFTRDQCSIHVFDKVNRSTIPERPEVSDPCREAATSAYRCQIELTLRGSAVSIHQDVQRAIRVELKVCRDIIEPLDQLALTMTDTGEARRTGIGRPFEAKVFRKRAQTLRRACAFTAPSRCSPARATSRSPNSA